MFGKFILIGFVLISILFAVAMVTALVKVSGYWSRVEDERDRLEFMSKESKSNNED